MTPAIPEKDTMTESNKTVPLAEATVTQLRSYAELVLALDIPPTANRNTIIGKIKLVQPDVEAISLHDGPTAPAPAKAASIDPTATTVIINIQVVEEAAGGSEPVPVGVNGKVMLVPRGQWCEIPRDYLSVLMHAVETRYRQINHPDGTMTLESYAVHRFPHQIWPVGMHEPGEGVLRPERRHHAANVQAA